MLSPRSPRDGALSVPSLPVPPARPSRLARPPDLSWPCEVAILEAARGHAARWRGDVLISEVLATLAETDEPSYRELCATRRDPGRAVAGVLPAPWLA